MNEIDDRFLRLQDVITKTGRSKAAIYRMMEAGTFPRQVSIGIRAVGWRLSDIQQWMGCPRDYHAP